jgi:hypothetical protein
MDVAEAVELSERQYEELRDKLIRRVRVHAACASGGTCRGDVAVAPVLCSLPQREEEKEKREKRPRKDSDEWEPAKLFHAALVSTSDEWDAGRGRDLAVNIPDFSPSRPGLNTIVRSPRAAVSVDTRGLRDVFTLKVFAAVSFSWPLVACRRCNCRTTTWWRASSCMRR